MCMLRVITTQLVADCDSIMLITYRKQVIKIMFWQQLIHSYQADKIIGYLNGTLQSIIHLRLLFSFLVIRAS